MTYLVLGLFALSEKTKQIVLVSKARNRAIFLATVYTPFLAGITYWINLAGSVEAVPIFPAFVVIFYGWILAQAYFIAMPVSQATSRLEANLIRRHSLDKVLPVLGKTSLILPILPLMFGVWEISSWATDNYQNIQGASIRILLWTLTLTITLVTTYFVMLLWGWKTVKENNSGRAVFAGLTFLLIWAYSLYRATGLLTAFVSQNQPSSALIDSGFMIIAILGAMQTFARKTFNRANQAWSRVLPFLVFSFGSIYAVVQFYYILQVPLNRADLSMTVNGIILVTSLVTMMLLIRKHLFASNVGLRSTSVLDTNTAPEDNTVETSSSEAMNESGEPANVRETP